MDCRVEQATPLAGGSPSIRPGLLEVQGAVLSYAMASR